jgi:predicted  nucleic acid-binding Zn-ribbon protein
MPKAKPTPVDIQALRATITEEEHKLVRYQAEYAHAEEEITSVEKQLSAMGFKPPFEDAVTAAEIALVQQEAILKEKIAALEKEVAGAYESSRD